MLSAPPPRCLRVLGVRGVRVEFCFGNGSVQAGTFAWIPVERGKGEFLTIAGACVRVSIRRPLGRLRRRRLPRTLLSLLTLTRTTPKLVCLYISVHSVSF
jgi:hypothetical protein